MTKSPNGHVGSHTTAGSYMLPVWCESCSMPSYVKVSNEATSVTLRGYICRLCDEKDAFTGYAGGFGPQTTN